MTFVADVAGSALVIFIILGINGMFICDPFFKSANESTLQKKYPNLSS
jgi:uncharacterized membrane protein YuzA (DUF378 family)